MHYYKRHIGDYHKKAGRLSMLEHGAYTLLIDACYDREKFPSLDDAIEWSWARTPEEIDAIKFVLSKFFILHDGIYTQSRIIEETKQYHLNSATNKRIAIEREEKRRIKTSRTVHEPYTLEHEPPPNQEPLTTNQEPLTTNQEPIDKSIVTSKLADACPHQKIVDLYHEKLPTMPRVKEWTEARKKHLQARWREKENRQNLEYWSGFFGFVAESDFLCGRTAKPFNCDLEWLIKSANFVKIIEGKYVNA